jgi:ribonuclease E
MANKMLIDATHPEETRVVVLRGNRVEEFDFETAQRKQLRGNIYLAKVTRVEPSLQAAFVDYGGNRHGFLAFSEIHPDYYQIPVADRQLLIDEEARDQRAAEDEADRRSRRHRGGRGRPFAARRDEEVRRSELAETPASDAVTADELADAQLNAVEPAHEAVDEFAGSAEAEAAETEDAETEAAETEDAEAEDAEAEDAESSTTPEPQLELPRSISAEPSPNPPASASPDTSPGEIEPDSLNPSATASADDADASEGAAGAADEPATAASDDENGTRETADGSERAENGEDDEAAEEIVESVGGADALEEVPDRAPRYRRQYKIQEVIKRRQVMLVQVVKEERGTKGAALTTYLSLAGRYSVLMPNTARGGGISRKITSAEDRSRLKEIAQELEVPEGMGVILRTAGASRTKTEVKRDFEYLLRLWETVRDLTLKSTAPKLVYEEGSLVKRSIRDLYSKDIDEVIVAGPDSYHEAKDFMRMLMPSHAKNVKLYSDTQPLLSRYGVENQLDGMFSPVVQLRSGGYIVLNQAEALVAIDVNSGRATREHHIEDTALKTNLEAADEIARQLRLRDLAGLIVIDFIDMEEKRNNRSVERRLKECLKQDRARIQVGRISHFGLLEMSRQRIRTSVLESSTEKCPYCGGSGHVRSVSSLALQVLRALEEQLIKGATHNLVARTRPDVALYVLNQKRAHLRGLEERFAITITVSADETLTAPVAFAIDRGEQVHTLEAAKALAVQSEATAAPLEEEDDLEEAGAAESEEAEAPAAEVSAEQDEGGGRRRRRRRRRGRNGGGEAHAEPQRHEDVTEPVGEAAADTIGEMPADDLAEEFGETAAARRRAAAAATRSSRWPPQSARADRRRHAAGTRPRQI